MVSNGHLYQVFLYTVTHCKQYLLGVRSQTMQLTLVKEPFHKGFMSTYIQYC